MNSRTVKKSVHPNSKPNKSTELIPPNSFPVVAIGASAGGLEAMTELLKSLPDDTGMAFIYVQHLSPDHKSMLPAILSKLTKMMVQEIDDMDKIKPNNVFVIPYNKAIKVTDGHIKLIPRSKGSMAITIDILFSSLAQAQKERVIGIILSGSASDGTNGMKEIKLHGGLTFAQDQTAKFPSMPQSAIAAGYVDYILSPGEIAMELSRLSKHPYIKIRSIKPGKEDLIDNNDPDLKTIIHLVHKSTGSDFSLYKMNTIKRRIVRRMLLNKINTLSDYGKFLIDNTEEMDILYQDLLINVTSFFRETETYTYLKSKLLPKLLKEKTAGESLRIWVPACSTGEEAFSIAIMLLELQDGLEKNIPIQIFATDLSEKSIEKARIGLYTQKDLELISPIRIQRFFAKTEWGYRIAKTVRDICVFAPHNILADPPFSRLDFISCCNLFIYLDTTAQKKVVRTFQYALNNGGYLMVGKSEAIGLDYFDAYNKKFKIYVKKKNVNTRNLPDLSKNNIRKYVRLQDTGIRANKQTSSKNLSSENSSILENVIDNVLLSEYMPASVVINYNMEIQQFRGSTEFYLSHSAGKATLNIIKMARPEIAFELRNMISKVIRINEKVQKHGIEMKLDNDVQTLVSIEVTPLQIDWEEPLILVLFAKHEESVSVENHSSVKSGTLATKDRRIKKLEEELAAVQADALLLSQDHEEFSQELQSANEEVISSNEELQTLNEELETSKEEIESTNEELITTNQELQTRNEQLDESYNFLEALTATIHEPMIVLDKHLCIKSANRSFYKDFKVSPEETKGMQLYQLGNKQWNIPRLRSLLENIVSKNTHFQNYEISYNLPASGERILLLNASRIIQKTDQEQLILLAIHDITEVRMKTLLLQQKEKELHMRELDERKAEKENLKIAVSERTKELKIANESLFEKNVELQKMNKELESFTYVSSHDLQEPLRKIQTFVVRLLQQEHENLSEKGKTYFKIIQSTAQRMQALIQDLLAFSSLNKAEREFENTDLRKLTREVITELKTEIKNNNATIEIGKMGKLYVIPYQFKQVFQNLISNSIKFANPKRPLHITIESSIIKTLKDDPAIIDAKKGYCLITYSDNGIGFEKKYNEKIFELFQRLHGHDVYPGTGIGLAIVKRIVENHNGIVKAKGALHKGATFDLYIPIQ